MRALVLCLLCLHRSSGAPAYFASVANQALRLRGGAALGPDLSVRAVTELEVQVGDEARVSRAGGAHIDV